MVRGMPPAVGGWVAVRLLQKAVGLTPAATTESRPETRGRSGQVRGWLPAQPFTNPRQHPLFSHGWRGFCLRCSSGVGPRLRSRRPTIHAGGQARQAFSGDICRYWAIP
jgi:hypothetical protein